MNDVNHFEQTDHFVDAPYPTGDAGACWDAPTQPAAERLVDQAMRNVDAGRSAHALLRDIDAGIGRPDELADRLLALLVGVDDAHRADVVKGFLRPIEKRLEAYVARVRGAA